MPKLKNLTLFLIAITWPLSLLIANTPKDFLSYIIPLSPKFAILPLLFVLFFYQFKKPKFILISLVVLVIFFKPFFGQTIFTKDYEAEQKILQEQKLYPSIFLARLFQNKPKIFVDKFTNNFFAITDPNNYFFGFAPRQITVNNQNLKKFPFLALPFLLIGIFYFKKIKNYKLLLAVLIAIILNLSILTNFDRQDFILWIPLFLIIANGINIFNEHFKYSKYYYLIFIIFSSIEILRILIK